ncbi:MAG TPA: cytochrome c biogenesis protein ResB [Salinivirga sp.]|uniref:cytochrome c biogenesis protein ResB n=1 Tax=Salinivirga sp. TaxID=1970192 RepID=UPI002B47D38E|nr:cytochrome c biogenesis protein ResB [Salinivirga sp.]HKK60350.1 cytochrome c biogenesis protein ResB [Salinivirga sp.]
MNNNVRKFWRQPWGYPEGILLAVGLFITGLALDFFTRTPIPKPTFPFNISLGALLISILAVLHFYRKSSRLIRWMSSVPAAISALGLFTLLSVLMGLIPQQAAGAPGLFNMLDSWAYLLSYAWLLIVLGLSALKRIRPFKLKHTGYLLNHVGLWIAFAAAGLGAGDLSRLNMYLQEGQTTWYAYNENRTRIELPFAFKLKDFVLENYPAKIALISQGNSEILKQNGKPLIADLPVDDSINMAGYNIRTMTYISNAIRMKENHFQPSQDTGAVQAAMMSINGVRYGWVSPGNFMYASRLLSINDSIALAMLKPEPKRYASEVEVFSKNGNRFEEVIEVNKPLRIEGWKVYQTDYDQRFGRWSRLSVLELVRDPWLPVVYVGLFMMIAGAFWLIFQGKTRKS